MTLSEENIELVYSSTVSRALSACIIGFLIFVSSPPNSNRNTYTGFSKTFHFWEENQIRIFGIEYHFQIT